MVVLWLLLLFEFLLFVVAANGENSTCYHFPIFGLFQVWEDSHVLRRGLCIKEGDTVLSIAAAGDNCLSLLLDNPAKIVAIDISPAQLALCHLKVNISRLFKFLTLP